MHFFRQKPVQETPSIETLLELYPDHMYVCDTYLAVYHPASKSIIVVDGDFATATDEEVNRALQIGLRRMQASQN